MKLVRAWMAGDTAGAGPRGAAAAAQGLARASSAGWSPTATRAGPTELDARLKGKGRTVVVVGVGHLVGRTGLPARLRAKGLVEGSATVPAASAYSAEAPGAPP